MTATPSFIFFITLKCSVIDVNHSLRKHDLNHIWPVGSIFLKVRIAKIITHATTSEPFAPVISER